MSASISSRSDHQTRRQIGAASTTAHQEPRDASVLELCSQIVARHHEGTRAMFPLIKSLLKEVVSAHGENHPGLLALQRSFDQLRAELEPHMRSEEELLFPAYAALERRRRPLEEALVAAHERDHASLGDGLLALRVLADGYDRKRAVCGTHVKLLDALAAFDQDLRRHIDAESALNLRATVGV